MNSTQKPKKVGRPKAKIDAEKVYQCALEGLTRQRIAIKCGVSKTTFHNYLGQDGEVKQAYDKGTADFLALVEKCLGEKALEGDTSAIKFILQTRDKETYSMRQEITGAGSNPLMATIRAMTDKELHQEIKRLGYTKQ